MLLELQNDTTPKSSC